MKLRVAYDEDDDTLEIRNDKLFPWFESMGWPSSGPDDDTWEVPAEWQDRIEEEISRLNNNYETRMVAVWGESVWVTKAELVTPHYKQLCNVHNLAKKINAALPEGMKIVLLDGPVERSASDYGVSAPARCQRCCSPVKDGWCTDDTCPYSDWPQSMDMDSDFTDGGNLVNPDAASRRRVRT